MAPADLRKEGSAYDLTLTIGILVASANHCSRPRKVCDNGRLSLTGLQPIRGALPCHQKAKEGGLRIFCKAKCKRSSNCCWT
jgi:magnesium chelatase family protein